MSNMEANWSEYDSVTHSPKTAAALASIEREQMKRRVSNYALTSAIRNYGDAAQSAGIFGRASRGAKWLCIWFAMIAPVLLFWHVIL